MNTARFTIFVYFAMIFGNVAFAENGLSNKSWQEFLTITRRLEIGMPERDVREILGPNYYEKKEGDRTLVQYSYSSFKGPVPDYKSIRSVKLVFAKEYKGDKMILSEISYACYMMISPIPH